jgi:hypothetical protein
MTAGTKISVTVKTALSALANSRQRPEISILPGILRQ